MGNEVYMHHVQRDYWSASTSPSETPQHSFAEKVRTTNVEASSSSSFPEERNRERIQEMKLNTGKQAEILWPRIVMKKLFNTKDPEFLSDTYDEGDSDSNSDADDGTSAEPISKSRRRNSETLRTQYINTKELRICVGTWNVGGLLPSEDLDIRDWIDMDKPADVYVFGLQEIVPLDAGNIFGAKDGKPGPIWENIIHEALNRGQPINKNKSYSCPPSPSRFKPADDFPDIEDETDSNINKNKSYSCPPSPSRFKPADDFPDIEDETDSDTGDEAGYPLNEKLDSLETSEPPSVQQKGKLTKQFSASERIGLSWPEPPLNLLDQRVLENRNSSKSVKSFGTVESFNADDSFKSSLNEKDNSLEAMSLINKINLKSMIHRKKRPHFLRIISKQMVAVFLSVWVRRSLRKHVQNLKVSTVGVGLMGYGNKGSISISMSIYQTLFCFICSHLSSGVKYGNELRRNADVHKIHRRTQFRSIPRMGLPQKIHDHERIIWLGDLNCRINLSYEEIQELILKNEWSELAEKDQLVQELKKGRTFDGWTEGKLNFAPTYGEDPKTGRLLPAWRDRVLSYGKGLKVVSYRRTEKMLSDRRPVTATYTVEVEVFSSRKLQRALMFTEAELENGGVIEDMKIIGMS